MQEMRQDTVIAVGLQEKAHHGQQALDRRGAADPASGNADDDGHDAEAAAAGGHDLQAILRSDVATFSGEAALGMGKVPEIAEGLALHEVEQGIVVEIDGARGRLRSLPGRAAILARFCLGLGPHLVTSPCRPFLHVAERPSFAALPATRLPAAELWLEPVGEAATVPAPGGGVERR